MLSVFPWSLDQSTDREFHSLVGTAVDHPGRPASQRSKIRPLTVDQPGRPAFVRSSDRLQQLYFSDQIFLGFSPMTLLSLVGQFSSLINSGRLLQ